MSGKFHQQNGFTVLELMIATLVFAVILLIVTTGIIKINNTYYKGINTSNTQDAARTVMDDIGQNIQFNQGAVTYPASYPIVPGSVYSICVGAARYTVQLNTELVDSTPNIHALVKDNGCGSSPAPSMTAGIPSTDTEMLSRNMRVALLTVNQIGASKLYIIHVRVVYGDPDLLCSASVGDCTNLSTNNYATGVPPDLGCKTQAGSQFCSVSDLTTTVEKRT